MRGAVLDITDRRQAEEQVGLLQTILMDVSAAHDLSSTLWVVLRRVCEKTGWAYGQAWLPRPDGSVLDCGPAWFSDPGFEKFRAISQQITFPPGKGLPGRVWLSKQPAWLENATLDPNFPRAKSAAQAGLRTALALPIITENEIVSVLEFFVREPRAEDKRLVNVILAVAAQLGLVIARRQAEEEIRQHAARMETLAGISQALAEVSLDAQAVFDTIARYTAEHIGDSCTIRLLSRDEQWLDLVAFHNPIPEMAALLRPAYLTPMPADQPWFRQVLQTGQSLLLPVITQEQIDELLPVEFRFVAPRFRLHSAIIAPLRVQGQVIGSVVMTRVDPAGAPYTPNDQVLLQELADRAGLTIQNARFFEQVKDAREQLEALSRRLLEVQEIERRAITRELHDRVGENLTGLSINLQNMKALLSRRAALALSSKFDDAQALVEDTTRQIRDIMAELHVPELEYYGLAAALEIYAERAAARGNLELIASLPDLAPPPLPSNMCIALFRAAQESINNILKHADARHLELSLEEQHSRICLKIEDDGQGFQPDLVSRKEAQTWGLKIMRERIEAVGGRVQIQSELGRGTRVIFETRRPL
jgi:signal transduction histidine kinase